MNPASRAKRGEPLGIRGAALARRAARTLALRFHQPREAGLVDAEACLLRELGGELDREAVGVVQPEGIVGGDRCAALGSRPLDHVVEQRRARLQRRREALLLGLEQPPDIVAVLAERGMELAQLLDHEILQAAEERARETDARAVLHGTPDDPAQDVAAALVRRHDAVGREHGHRAAVVGEHAAAPSARLPRWRSGRPSSPRPSR